MTKRSSIRDRAIAAGLKTYIGRPCKVCLGTEKYVTNWCCVECTKKKTLARSPEVGKRYSKSSKGKNTKKEYRKQTPYRQTQLRWIKKDYQINKEKYFGYSLRKYKITKEEYQEALIKQDFRCYICETHQQDLKRRLAVDHCHKTGNVRKLLCSNCNTALGLLKEDTSIMKKLIEYVGESY